MSNWARAAITAASEKNIIGGYPDGRFNPDGSATRAEAASVLIRALEQR
ncbi:S-layer homology domain-containing protein [Paenibacillus selenitireducens]